jgi:hypothetical protein
MGGKLGASREGVGGDEGRHTSHPSTDLIEIMKPMRMTHCGRVVRMIDTGNSDLRMAKRIGF